MMLLRSTILRSAVALSVLAAAAFGLTAEPAAKRVEIPATIKYSDSGLELLACKFTRAHETILMIPTAPDDFLKQVKSLGVRPSSEWPGSDEEFVEHWGDRLMVWIEWKEGDVVVRRRAEDLILDMTEGRPVRRTGWVFQGKPGEEIEMPLTFKGLNPAAGAIASTYLVLPRAYLEDSFRPTAPFYRPANDAYPKKVAAGEGTLPAKLIVESTTEERLVQADIEAAKTEAQKGFHRGLLETAKRIDGAKKRIFVELLPAHDALEKKIVELAKIAGKEAELEPLVWRGRSIQSEVKSLLKQCRRDLMELELAYAGLDLAAIKANPEKYKEVHDADAVGWKERTIHEFKTYRDTADRERKSAELVRDRHARTAEWIAKAGQAPKDAPDSADSVRRWIAEQTKAGRLAAEALTEFDLLRLSSAIEDNHAEIGRAEIKLVRSRRQFVIEKGRNDELVKMGRELSDFAKEIVRRIAMYVDEATARQALCRARIAAAETHMRLLKADAALKPELEALLKQQQERVAVCGMKQAVLALEEEIDDLDFAKGKELGNKEAEAKIQQQIDERRVRQKDLRSRIGDKPGC